ncbi:MAG: UDP-N-acetylmuramoyl-L-alanine--D-glutamate ligase [Actinomycetota bacterium]|nr:UDP-N-acetylmuramoyl-L-alanine--D-glutamate ligase [Actinomycetota bacterium]MDP3630860.1 UDP-N-acetylmuramoyl-L-alanine--D-glutamate ligase [Actinomycetota bacterium]
MELCGHIVVLGAGRSGRAVVEHVVAAVAQGAEARVTLVDGGSGSALEERAAFLRTLGANVVLGSAEIPADADLIVASPGIPPSSTIMIAAHACGVPVISELEFAYRVSSASWIAITGTNGKTTTTALVEHLLRESGIPAESVGNIGRAATRVAGEAGPATVLVAEVSSFQLALTEQFHPRVAVLLNITPDHVDWHGSLEAYAADKARVFANQTRGDTAVIDIDDSGSAPNAALVEARGVDVRQVSLSQSGGHALLDGDMLVLMVHDTRVPLVRRSDLRIRGEHNVSNALAAAAAAYAIGARIDSIRTGLRTFEPIEHRLESVCVVRGVEYFNDSKATNPDAVLKALTAFEDRPLVVLLGGHNKGNEFEALARAVCARCKAVVVFGESAGEFEAAFAAVDAGFRIARADGMAGAVTAAASVARAGDVVVLSPACASFDEFNDYEHRGRVFREMIRSLDAGEA